MSRTQKHEIFKALPSSLTINGASYTVSKKYANQFKLDENTVLPVITLNFPIMGGKSLELPALAGSTRYYSTTLTIHIYAEASTTDNGAVIAEGIAQEIITTIAGWELSPITGGTMIISRMLDINPLNSSGILDQFSGTSDYILSINLTHE